MLEKLAALNIGSETVAALALVPLIAIAWSDGSIDDKERAAVFARAQEEGASQGDVSRELFERWLSERPPANLLAMWKDYVRALMETMSAEDRRFFKGRVLDRARGVAEAAGGFLGIGSKVSAAEQKISTIGSPPAPYASRNALSACPGWLRQGIPRNGARRQH